MRWSSAALAIGASILSFLGFDFAAAVTGIVQPVPRDNCVISSDLYGYTFEPNCVGRNYWGFREYELRVNALGMRAAETGPLAPKVRRRVVIVGDSFTSCCLPWSETVAGQLNRLDPRTEYLTAGMSSYSPSVYAIRIPDLTAHGLDADEVIVFPDISDYRDEARRIDVSPGRVRLRQEWRKPVRSPLALAFPMTHRLYITGALAIRHSCLYVIDCPFPTILDIPEGAWHLKPENDPLFAPIGKAAAEAKIFDRMSRLADFLAARDIPLSVVVYPWPAQVEHRGAGLALGQQMARLVRRPLRPLRRCLPHLLRRQEGMPARRPPLLVRRELHFRRRAFQRGRKRENRTPYYCGGLAERLEAMSIHGTEYKNEISRGGFTAVFFVSLVAIGCQNVRLDTGNRRHRLQPNGY